MSALTIAADPPELTVGETVAATVTVAADLPDVKKLIGYAEAHGLHLAPRRYGEVELHAGPLTKGQTFSLSVTLPHDAPFTFAHDERHSLSWRVVAEGELPGWVVDETATAPFTVRPVRVEPTEEAIAALTTAPKESTAEPSWIANAFVWTLGAIVAVCALPLLPFALIYLANRRIERTRVTDFELDVPKRHLALGEWVPFVIRFRVKRPVDVASLTLSVQGTKRWRSGDRSRTHRFHEEKVTVLQDAVLAPRTDPATRPPRAIYRAPVTRTGEPGLFEVTVPMRLPPDGWPSFRKISYQASATLALRGWPDPSARAQLQTLSAVVEPAPDRPHALTAAEASPGVAIVPAGDDPPPGVDVTIARDTIWPWVAIPTAGVAIVVAALGTALTEAEPALHLLLPAALVGTAIAAFGLWGFYTRLYR